MARCIVIAPLYDGSERELLKRKTGDLLICADGGYAAAKRFGIIPDLVIGDFDSMPPALQPDCSVIRLPVRKDDTDLVVCLRHGWDNGYRSFVIAGALGGRLDHTISALQAAKQIALDGGEILLTDARNRLAVLAPGSYSQPEWILPERKLSLLAASDVVKGVTLRGAEWELTDAELTSVYPLGCSNQMTGPVELSFTEGLLYVVSCAEAE